MLQPRLPRLHLHTHWPRAGSSGPCGPTPCHPVPTTSPHLPSGACPPRLHIACRPVACPSAPTCRGLCASSPLTSSVPIVTTDGSAANLSTPDSPTWSLMIACPVCHPSFTITAPAGRVCAPGRHPAAVPHRGGVHRRHRPAAPAHHTAAGPSAGAPRLGRARVLSFFVCAGWPATRSGAASCESAGLATFGTRSACRRSLRSLPAPLPRSKLQARVWQVLNELGLQHVGRRVQPRHQRRRAAQVRRRARGNAGCWAHCSSNSCLQPRPRGRPASSSRRTQTAGAPCTTCLIA